MAADARTVAAQVIAQVLGGKSLNQVLPGGLQRVAARDRGLLQQLCFGTLRAQPRLQGVLEQLLAKPLRDKDRDVQALLLCGLYQLDGMRTPDHAAVAATVGATGGLKKSWARGLANAVLRRFLRERDDLLRHLDEAAAASHPDWLYRALRRQWPERAADIMAANNEQPPMTLRVNTIRQSRQQYLEKLAATGLEAAAGELSPLAVTLARPCDVSELPGFAAGEVSVQDEAAQLAAPLLGARPGERVLDACAAPGGKTCHLLELEPRLGELVAMDLDETRLQRVADNLQRLQLAATLLCGDARRPDRSLAPASFDRIMVDAPCSATGVIRRHPDVKILRREADIASLALQQLEILHGLWPLLRPGGRMLYVTCSVLGEENSEVIGQFLEQKGAAAELEKTELACGELLECGRQVLPAIGGPDGLFFARLLKRE